MPFTTTATAPTADDIYTKSKLSWGDLGYADASEIEEIREAAIAYVTWVTGRYFSDFVPPGITDSAIQMDFTPSPVAAAPELISLMKRAVRMRTEQQAMQDQEDYIDTATDDLISSFSAGPYSESRRDLSRRGEQKALNLWPGLNDLLTQLMTEERREFWLLLAGGNVPAFSVEEVDWSLVGKSPIFPSVGDPFGSTAPFGPRSAQWWE